MIVSRHDGGYCHGGHHDGVVVVMVVIDYNNSVIVLMDTCLLLLFSELLVTKTIQTTGWITEHSASISMI